MQTRVGVAVVAALAVALGGCATAKASRGAVMVGAFGGALGLVTVGAAGQDEGGALLGAVVVAGALAVMGGGTIGMIVHGRPRRLPDPGPWPVDPVAAEPDPRRRRASTIMQASVRAAGVSDCAAVRAWSLEVAALDATFHATTFVRDAAIARCLQPTR